MASASFEARQDRRSLRSASDALPVCMQSVCASCGAGRASHLLCALPMTLDGYASTAKRHAHGGAKRGPTLASQLGSATFGIVQWAKPRRRCHAESSEFAQVNAAVITICADAGVCVCESVSKRRRRGGTGAFQPTWCVCMQPRYAFQVADTWWWWWWWVCSLRKECAIVISKRQQGPGLCVSRRSACPHNASCTC